MIYMNKKTIKIAFFLFFVVIAQYLLELIYRVIVQSIWYDTSIKGLIIMANNMISYHIVFNILYLPVLLILILNIKQHKLLFFLNFLIVTLFCIFFLKTDYLNSDWFLNVNFSLSVSSFILFVFSLLCPNLLAIGLNNKT